MKKNPKFRKYFREYEWSNVFAMIRNNRLDPEICNDDFKNKLVVITGATSGIGYLTSRKYAAHGADLLSLSSATGFASFYLEQVLKEYCYLTRVLVYILILPFIHVKGWMKKYRR